MSLKRQGERHQATTANPAEVNVEQNGRLRQEIELRAYSRYCERGCAPGGDREDWLAAEQEVLATHAASTAASKAQ